MSTWKKIVAVDADSSSADNSFVTINADESVEVIRINDLPSVPLSGDYTSVSEVLIDNGDNFVLPVDAISSNAHYKISIDDIAGMLTVGMIYNLVEEGAGDISTYTGTSGTVGDFNGDGSVSTADLLQFLTMFGQAPDVVFSSGYLNITNCPTLTSLPNVYDGTVITSDSQANLLPISNGTGNAGSFESTVNSTSGNHYIEWGETTGIDWNSSAFSSKRLKIAYVPDAFKFIPTAGSAGCSFWVKAETFTGNGTSIESVYIALTYAIAPPNSAGEAIYLNCPARTIGGDTDAYISLDEGPLGQTVASVRLKFFAQNLYGDITSAEIESINTFMYP